jgi:rod shape determining protein RodA
VETNTENKSLFANVDYLALFIIFALMVIGFFNIYSAEYSDEQKKVIDFSMSHGKQLINIAIALVLAVIIFLLDARIFHTIAYFVYAFGILLLLITLGLGTAHHAAKGWLAIGGFQLQTAEFGKFATAMALAKYLSTHGVDIRVTRDRLYAFAIILLPCLIVLLQNDTGSALVFFSMFFVLFREGLNPLYLIIPLWIGIVSLSVLMAGQQYVLIGIGIIALLGYLYLRRQRKLLYIFTLAIVVSVGVSFGVDYGFNHIFKDYQRDRIEILLGKKVDAKGAGYNVHQSLIAIGSGGVIGKGYLKGTQTKFRFVPEQTTDFIFCTIGEEWGFAGSFLVIMLYVVLMYRIVRMAERQKFEFNRFYAYGAMGIIFFHFFINIGMTLGLFPVVGIPLPFISYGGSSMLTFTIMLFILLKLDAANSTY